MNIWKRVIWPFLSKAFKYVYMLFERTATEIAKKIPERVIEPIKNKIIELAQDQTLNGSEKMKALKEYAVTLLGTEFSAIGNSALDTFLQVFYQDLKDRGTIM